MNEELKPLVGGLLRTHKLEYVLMEQKKRMEAEILNVGRTVVTTYLSESWRSGSSALYLLFGRPHDSWSLFFGTRVMTRKAFALALE